MMGQIYGSTQETLPRKPKLVSAKISIEVLYPYICTFNKISCSFVWKSKECSHGYKVESKNDYFLNIIDQ